MKFYGVTMQGKFVNQTLATVPETFSHDADTGRLIYNEEDGFLWWGDGETDIWRSIAEGADVAGEAEDMYSDLLRTTIFLNGTWDEFYQNMGQDLLVDKLNSSSILEDNWDADLKAYEFTLDNLTLTSEDMFDEHLNLSSVRYCMPSVWWVDGVGNHYPPKVEVNNGFGWERATNNDVHRFANPDGTILLMRVTSTQMGGGTGTLLSWGILYNKDLSIDCSRSALTQYEKVIDNEITDTIGTPYKPGFILVYLNGILQKGGTLAGGDDYEATDGETITFAVPTLKIGDVVNVISFGTAAMIGPDEESDAYIRRDGTLPWIMIGGQQQDVGGGILTNLGDGVDDSDSVNIGQLSEVTYSANRHSRLYPTDTNDPPVLQTTTGSIDCRANSLIDVASGSWSSVSSTDGINGGNLADHADDKATASDWGHVKAYISAGVLYITTG